MLLKKKKQKLMTSVEKMQANNKYGMVLFCYENLLFQKKTDQI